MIPSVLQKLACKYGYKIPELLARAAAGDVVAITILSALGITAVAALIVKKN